MPVHPATADVFLTLPGAFVNHLNLLWRQAVETIDVLVYLPLLGRHIRRQFRSFGRQNLVHQRGYVCRTSPAFPALGRDVFAD